MPWKFNVFANYRDGPPATGLSLSNDCLFMYSFFVYSSVHLKLNMYGHAFTNISVIYFRPMALLILNNKINTYV